MLKKNFQPCDWRCLTKFSTSLTYLEPFHRSLMGLFVKIIKGRKLLTIFHQNFHQDISSVIRQKGRSQNGCFKKTKHVKFSEKRTFLTRWYAHVREMFVFRKIWHVCFLDTPVLRFTLLAYNRRFDIICWHNYDKICCIVL